MHLGGQTKTVPINRITHAILESIYPLSQGNVNFHLGKELGVFLSYGDQSRGTLTVFGINETHWTHSLCYTKEP